MGGDEVLVDVQPLAEVGGDGVGDDRTVRSGHQTTHASQLANLRRGAPGAGVCVDEHRVEGVLLLLLAVAIDYRHLGDAVHHRARHLVVGPRPDVNHLVVLLALGEQSGDVLSFHLLHLILGVFDDLGLLVGYDQIIDADGCAGSRRMAEARVHELVGEHHRVLQADVAIAIVDQPGNRLLVHGLVDRRKGQFAGHDLVQQHPAHRGVNEIAAPLAWLAHLDLGVQVNMPAVVGAMHFVGIGEDHALALGVDALAGHVVHAKHHVLGRHDDRLAAGRRQDVVGGHHQCPGLQLGLQGERHVNRHLIAVEVGVVSGADQGMELDGLAFDQHWLEGLNAETVQRWRPVQQHRMLADDLGQNVPDFRGLAFDHLLGGLDGGGQPAVLELAEDEGLEQLQGHLLGQAALMQLQRRPDHDHRTSRVIDPFAEQVLPETALLALDHVRERLQRPLVGAGDGPGAAAVVEQRIDRFLQHALFVAYDDVWRRKVEQTPQAIVAVDDPAVKVVQIRGGEAAAVQGNERAQIRRQHRQHLEDHPLRLVAGIHERFHQLQALGELLDLGFRIGGRNRFAKLLDLPLQVHRHQQFLNGLGTHAGVEFAAVLLQLFVVFLVGEQLALRQVRQAGLHDHMGLEVEHPLYVPERHVEQQADARRQRLQKPDVGDRAGQVDVPHAFPAHLGQGHLHAALLANHAAMLHALVLAAQALVVLHRTEDAGAEQAIPLRLEGAVVDGLRFAHFAK